MGRLTWAGSYNMASAGLFAETRSTRSLVERAMPTQPHFCKVPSGRQGPLSKRPRFFTSFYLTLLLTLPLPVTAHAQSLSTALGQAVASTFKDTRVILVPTSPCVARGGNCDDVEDLARGIDLAAVAREIPGAVEVTSTERGGARAATAAAECQEPMRCVVVGFRLRQFDAEAGIARLLIEGSYVRGPRTGILTVADYLVDLRRRDGAWEVVTVKLDRVS